MMVNCLDFLECCWYSNICHNIDYLASGARGEKRTARAAYILWGWMMLRKLE
jgi:hypothetical protein